MEGCLCQGCARRYKVDFLLPDDLWLIIARGANLLCGQCIAGRLEQLNKYDYWHLTKPVGKMPIPPKGPGGLGIQKS